METYRGMEETVTLAFKSAVGVVITLRGGGSGFNTWQAQEISPSTFASRPAVGPNLLLIQWVLGHLAPGVKRPRRGAHHSLPSGAVVMNKWSSTYALSLHKQV